MATNIITRIIEMLKMAGINYSKIAGKIDPNKVKQLVTKTQKTATKPKLIDALNKDKATFGDALKIFEDEAQYISQMNEMELANFANNLSDYFTVGGKKKNIPSNVVTTEGAPVSGKKLETLSERKGAKGEADTGSLQGSMQGLASLIDEIKGISPKMRNQMDRDELAAFIQKMRGRKFTNEEIKWVKAEMDEWGIGIAKEKATGMQYGKKLGAKSKEEFEFVKEYVDNLNSYSPKEFKANYGTVKNVNMDISNIIDSKLEKHFKKKYKWDDTKKDGGLDDATYEKYDDELYGAQKEFGDFHTVYDSGPTNMWGQRKGKSWANHPNNYLDEASEKFESITGQGLNVDFFKKYTDDVLTKYVEPEKFQYGGPVVKGPDMGSTAHGSAELASRQRMLQPGGQMTTSTGLNYLLGEDDNNRIPFNDGRLVNSIPPEYRLYAGTMLPWNKTGTVDESYFNQDFKDKLKDQVLNKMNIGMQHETPKAMFPSGTVREGTIYPRNYGTPANPSGYVDRDSLTGYDSVFNTLGTYNYKYNMPTAPAFDNASIDIIDKYDWNPGYGTVGDFTGYIGRGFGEEGTEDYVEGKDVDLDMLKRFAINAFKKRKLNRNDALELVGNYLGPKQSKGEGKDIKINIPTNASTFAGNEGRQVSTKQGAVRGAQQDISNYQDFGEVPLADGGVAGLLGKRTGFDIGGGIFSPTPDTAVKFNLDGETIFLNPDFFEAFMGPYMNDPEKLKRRTDDLKQEIRRNQGTVALADGGRAGFSGGGMGRRGFLKLVGGTAAGIAAMKTGIVKLLSGPTTKKSIAKGITIPKTGGMPDWFEPLVNKVIKEGDDLTKQFATKEREIVNATKIGDDEMVIVYRDLDEGGVRVEYQSLDNLAEGSVQLEFKPGMADETTKGKKPPDEFKASEAEPEIVNWDGDIEMTGENLVDNVGGLTSDTTKLKEYAVGKDQVTIKEIVESIKKKRRAKKINEDPSEQINYIENKEGYGAMEYIDESERVGAFKNTGYETKGMNLPEKKAAGGIAGMLGE